MALIGVDKEHDRSGVGTALLEAVGEAAEARGAARLTGRFHDGNAPVRSFLEGYGMTCVSSSAPKHHDFKIDLPLSPP